MLETVLITGASGFIGCHLVRALVKEGYKVIAAVRNKRKFLEMLTFNDEKNRLTIIEVDLANIKTIRNMAASIKGSCYLVHLGAYFLKSSEQSKDYDGNLSISTNISGSYNLINSLKLKLSGVCLISTVDVFGNLQCLPINEDHKLSPETFYAASKIAMESYVAIELQGKIPLSILRLSHVYGYSDPHSKVLQSFVNNIRAGKNPVIYGDGADLRDHIHVNDVVEIILRIFRKKEKGVFIVASGNSYSLKEIAEISIKVSGKNLTPVYMERCQPRKDYVFDINKLKKVLNFSPQISLGQGIKELISIRGYPFRWPNAIIAR